MFKVIEKFLSIDVVLPIFDLMPSLLELAVKILLLFWYSLNLVIVSYIFAFLSEKFLKGWDD